MTPDHLDFALLVLRVIVGIVMLAHGVNHIFRGGRIEGTARWFASLGMRPGILHAWLASLTELVVGVMLVVGLLTPFAAAGVVGVITVAWVTNHVDNGFFIFRKGEGWEWVATLALSSLALALMGPGGWSLDEAFGVEANGSLGVAAAMLGPVAALSLLAAFWRPEADQRKRPAHVVAVFGAYAAVALAGVVLVGDGADGFVVEADQVSFGVLVLRVVLAVVMLAHGVNHIFRGGRIEGTARWFASLGMRPGILHAWLASLTELAVGVLLVLGLLTPFAAAGVVGVLVVAWTTNHVPNGFFTFRAGEGWEYVSFLSLVAVVVGTIGAGEWSIDHELELTDTFAGFTGFFVALVGALAALLLLLAFWRPDEVRNPNGVGYVFAFFGLLALAGALASQVDDEASPTSVRGQNAAIVVSGGSGDAT